MRRMTPGERAIVYQGAAVSAATACADLPG